MLTCVPVQARMIALETQVLDASTFAYSFESDDAGNVVLHLIFASQQRTSPYATLVCDRLMKDHLDQTKRAAQMIAHVLNNDDVFDPERILEEAGLGECPPTS